MESTMSVTLILQPCQFTGAQVAKKNPFTGKEQITHPTHPLAESQMQSIHRVLSKYTTEKQGEDGELRVIVFGEGAYQGSLIEVDVSDLANGCTMTLRGESPELYPFLFELLKTADWMIIASQSELLAIVESFDRLKNVPPDFMKIVQCESPKQLASFLGRGIQEAENYRRQVAGE
jgi:hypothetical protein